MTSDVLVIGGGLAGLRAAEAAASAGCTVTVLSKGPRCSADVSGYNAPVGANDSVELFVRDIQASGCTINDPALAEILAEGSLRETAFLESLGLEFQKTESGAYQLLQPLGCTVPRLLHTGTATGAEAERLLLESLEKRGVRVESPVTVVEILTQNGAACGVLAVKQGSEELTAYGAKAVVLAAGGCGGLYEISTYSKAICGDSAALAYRAGAEITNMEFIDFEPCCLVSPEHLRGRGVSSTMLFIGGVLKNSAGEDIIKKHFKDLSEVCKSKLAQAMWEEIQAGLATPSGGIWYDLTAIPREELAEHEAYLPLLERNGFDLSRDFLEVSPAAHTCLGGVKIDAACRSTVPGLFAAGEAVGNLHGANRIGGNAGSEVFVFGAIAGSSAAEHAEKTEVNFEKIYEIAESVKDKYLAKISDGDLTAEDCGRAIRKAVSAGVPLLRQETALREMIGELEHLLERLGKDTAPAAYLALLSMTQTARMIGSSSLLRQESRGVFHRSDYPRQRETFDRTNTVVSMADGVMKTRLQTQKD